MNKEDKFMKIVLKAEKGGYKEHLNMLPAMPMIPQAADLLSKKIFYQRRYEIIFSHEFAKGFWGTFTNGAGWTKESGYSKLERIEEWEYHLQRMVLEKEPLKYLENFLNKE